VILNQEPHVAKDEIAKVHFISEQECGQILGQVQYFGGADIRFIFFLLRPSNLGGIILGGIIIPPSSNECFNGVVVSWIVEPISICMMVNRDIHLKKMGMIANVYL
jgi:hypothetical protein